MTNKLKLIGLHGPAGCGKDTVAGILCSTQEFRQIALADPIRRGIVAMFGVPLETLTDRALKEQPLGILCGKSPRQIMQTLGTEWGRHHLCLDIWLRVAQREIDWNNELAATNNYYLRGIVVSDIRFEGEAKWIRDQGGEIWHVRRPNNPHDIGMTHASEQALFLADVDRFLINDGDLDQLHQEVARMLETMEEIS